MPEASSKLLKEKKSLEDRLGQADRILHLNDEIKTLLELAEEENAFYVEAKQVLESLKTLLEETETQSLLSGEQDPSSAMLTINAGAGGTESCDWASMLLRMYLRFAESKGWQAEIHDCQDGDGAGIKSATVEITGEYAYGLLKSESGVHRLVRISPFDANAKRHTSFASFFVSPIIDDSIVIEINPADLRIDTYRASGAGGQHINRTDSAVRITHVPTNTVVQCQSQRSQHQNKDAAMKMLRSKLFDLELEKRKKIQDIEEDNKAEIGWSSQIRSYVLHPYKLAKDHRTEFESHEPHKILDGELDSFIAAYLKHIRLG
jgi:peptide chain release factor 2